MTQTPSKPVTIQDVAREAGVSRAAVSKVIRNAHGVSSQMRENVNAAVERLNYRPRVAARAMRGASFTLGLEVPELGNQFFIRILRGATEALSGSPYRLLITTAGRGALEGHGAIEALADHQVDGMVVVAPLADVRWLEDVAARTPIVMLGRHAASSQFDTLTGNDVTGTLAALSHLAGLGHDRIAHLTLGEQISAPERGTSHSVRLATYLDWMERTGRAEHIRVERIVPPDEELAYIKSLELLDARDRPTAVFVCQDQYAMSLLRATTELGLTAADVSVIGYDGTDMAEHPRVALTTIDQDGVRLGRRAVQLLLDRIAGRTKTVHEVFEPTLRIRQTTVAPTRFGVMA
jgi:LacI family transcriptional regulator